MRRPFVYLLIAWVTVLASRVSLAQDRDTEHIPTRADLEDVLNPNLKHNRPQIIEFAPPIKFLVTAGHTYTLPLLATDCEALKKDGFEFKSTPIAFRLVNIVFKQEEQCVGDIDVPIVIESCVITVDVTIPRSLKGTHKLIYVPTRDVVATIKVSRDKNSVKTIDFRK